MNGRVINDIELNVADAIHMQAKWVGEGSLPVWTLYESPSDYPDHFVVRPHLAIAGETRSQPAHMKARTFGELEAAMAVLGLHWMPRFEQDETQIVGTWF